MTLPREPASIAVGPGNHLWVLARHHPEVWVFHDLRGQLVSSFKYNRYGAIGKDWSGKASFASHLGVLGENILVFDGWEGILHYVVR